jgi:cobaltochelatase CobN
LGEVIINNSDINASQTSLLGNVSSEVETHLSNAISYADLLVNGTAKEVDSLLDSLEGDYIMPNMGGDPIRSPEALPTGRNFYSFDQRRIPTEAAWATAVQITDTFLNDYRANHNNTYPEKVSYVLWAVETMRHQGVAESQILYLLGVKPKWKYGKIKGLELINESELGRPRIDVIVTTSGLYRDTFSFQMDLLDDAMRLAANAGNNTYPNYVREHYLELKAWLLSKGYNESEADLLAMSRIFSEPPGDYGIRVSDAASASNTWETTDSIAQLYIERMGNVYTGGEFYALNPDFFKQSIKNTDVALFSRTSNLYGAFDNDDVFQYFGGLSLAIAHASDARRPEMFIANLRDKDAPKMESLKEFLNTELRARYFNPKWIQGMMDNGYSGAGDISKFLENLWGWQVVDERMIDPETWDEIYEVYAQDKYNLGLGEWFEESSPWAKQAMEARMLEAIRKGYWNPSEDVKEALAKDYQELVDKYGVTCCHHTCANPTLDTFIQGILSVPTDNPQTYNSDDSGWDYRPPKQEANTTGDGQNETTSEGEVDVETQGQNQGYGTDTSPGTSARSQAKTSTSGEEVEGRIMKSEPTREEGTPTSAMPFKAIIISLGTTASVGYGFLKFFRKEGM